MLCTRLPFFVHWDDASHVHPLSLSLSLFWTLEYLCDFVIKPPRFLTSRIVRRSRSVQPILNCFFLTSFISLFCLSSPALKRQKAAVYCRVEKKIPPINLSSSQLQKRIRVVGLSRCNRITIPIHTPTAQFGLIGSTSVQTALETREISR